MALSDPQSLTIGANTRTLPRTGSTGTSSSYSDVDNGVEFKVSHQIGKRRRTSIRVDNEKIAADPITAVNLQIGSSIYIVIDAPLTGFTRTELKDQVLALTNWASASSAANLLKVLGEEH
jgi:hypothetical protein